LFAGNQKKSNIGEQNYRKRKLLKSNKPLREMQFPLLFSL